MMKCIPTRAVIAINLFMACCISYMLRVNMSINIIAMVDEVGKENQTTQPECRMTTPNATDVSFEKLTSLPNYGPRYQWDSKIQGVILGAYFWGNTISCIPGGLVAEKFGASRTILISTVVAAVLTTMTPLFATWHFTAVAISRFIIGLMGGVIYPSLHCLVSRWAPPEEKGKFVGALLGGSLGTIITWPVLGAIIEYWGWYYSFFIPGGIAVVWCILWKYAVSDTPALHKRIDSDEKIYIEKALGNAIRVQKGLPPYGKIFTSIPVWAFIALQFGNSWGLFFLMTAGPKYVSTVLGFDLKSSGFLSSLPYLARMVFGIIFGLIGDILQKRKFLSTTAIRKYFVLCSHFLPGLFLFLMTLTNCDIFLSVALMTMSLGSNGASSITNLANAQDLAPNYAGTLYGIANGIGSTSGFITPLITGYLTQDHNGNAEWRIIFIIGTSVYILCGLVFCIFGSGENQPWNIKESDEENKNCGIDNIAFEKEVDITSNSNKNGGVTNETTVCT